MKLLFYPATWLKAGILLALLLAAGCASAPVKSIEAAEEAIARVRAEAASPPCLEKLTSAEAYLEKAKRAMEQKNFEKAKTEVFDSLQQAYEAHRCAEENRKKEDLLEENPDG